MLTALAQDIWFAQHAFTVGGVPCTSRMTVVRLQTGGLWVHSPIPPNAVLAAQLDALGPVQAIVAPSLAHHLFAAEFAQQHPLAALYGAPGLAEKRPDLRGMQTLSCPSHPWGPCLQGVLFAGMPLVNETVWFHVPSATLILTDICQHWQGELPWRARAWARLTGVRSRLAVPPLIRLLTRDKVAAQQSAQAVLAWPFKRVVLAHNAIVTDDAHTQVRRAFTRFA